MAAYAALVSLSHTLRMILHPPPLNKIIIGRPQIEFLGGKVSFMIDFLETYSAIRGQEISHLETQIADAAYEAEDIIESNVVEQIRSKRKRKKNPTILYEGIQVVLQKLLSIEEELLKMKDREGLQRKNSIAATTRALPGGKITTMVGFEKHVSEITEAVTSLELNRQLIPIVGMGGIGKTTIATAIYNDSAIIEYFHLRVWVTVSQEYTVREILFCLLSEITKEFQIKQESTSEEIGELVYRELYDRRYLLVMDDMWDIQAWDKIRWFLPPNTNGSRIIVTTRLSNLAKELASCSSPHQIDLLDEEKSWDLLGGKVFVKEDCPVELEEIGKHIAIKCRGLPLALVLIGGLLTKLERTMENWESVEMDVTSAINYGNDEHLMKILSLSYGNLPIYLKPYFLYMAVFPEDNDIRISKLVRLWVAEGLIKHTQGKCLEEVALEYLEDLISRNLILVHKRGRTGKVKSCKIHDLVRDMCIVEAEKEKFVYIANLDNPILSPNMETKRRISISSPRKPLEETGVKSLLSARSNRSWLSHDKLLRYVRQEPYGIMGEAPEERKLIDHIIHGFRLLKVVEDLDIRIDIFNLCNLRYVVVDSVSSISSMSLCWNMQTLVVESILTEDLPAEIWQMPQLRHIKTDFRFNLPDPPLDVQTMIVLENLQTLKGIQGFKCTEKVVKRIPNLKKLQMAYDLEQGENVEGYCLKNLVYFEKLESLRIEGARRLWTGIALPISLEKLTLALCTIPWEDLSIVGSLPNLEVLKLYGHSTAGEEWNPIEGEFCRLKFLLIWQCELNIWRADSYNFPCLEHLVLGHVNLQEIPMSFAEIFTLEEIELCPKDSPLWSSAKGISNEREELGYDPLRIWRYDDKL